MSPGQHGRRRPAHRYPNRVGVVVGYAVTGLAIGGVIGLACAYGLWRLVA